MARGLSVSVRANGLAAMQKTFGNAKANMRAVTTRTMEQVVRLAEGELKSREFSGTNTYDAFWGVGGASGDTLGARSGRARSSITARVFSKVLEVVGVVGSKLKYVGLHERGGTVTGKPWLVIPTRVLQREGSGTSVLTGKSARSLPNTTIIRSKAGKLWIAEVGTARSKLNVEINGFPLLLALLVASVKFRPRRMFKHVLDRVLPRARSMFSASVLGVVKPR